MTENEYIEPDAPLSKPEDFSFLRAEGVKFIEKLAGKVWTDYNTHDPGITLLEAFCYAITDLGYRTGFPVKDILALPEKENTAGKDFQYTAEEILPAAPLTIDDYRKLIIDTTGVRNAWIEPGDDNEIFIYASVNQTNGKNTFQLAYNPVQEAEAIRLKGLYHVLVEFDTDIEDEAKKTVLERVKARLHAHRNLCEDFLIVSSVEFTPFSLDAEVQVFEGCDIEKINAQIFHEIQNLFSAPVRFYTIEQMMQKGYTTEQIFEGPLLRHGFIDPKELNNTDRGNAIHLSDVINVMLNIEGVIAIKRCDIPKESQTPYSTFNEWAEENRTNNRKLRLDIDNSSIIFHRSGDRHRNASGTTPSRERVKAIYSFLRSGQKTTKLMDPVTSIPFPKGEFMDLGEYYPLQHHLPSVYTEVRNNGDETFVKKRELQVRQLQSYLMVFEQILSDYLIKLSGIRKLYSFHPNDLSDVSVQPVAGIEDAPSLFLNYDHFRKILPSITESEEKYAQKRNRLLDHLLAQVAETMEGYSKNLISFRETGIEKMIRAKAAFLADYIQVSRYRGCGNNYTDRAQVWTSSNVPGVKKRIARLLGIDGYANNFITANWIKVEKNDKDRFLPVIYDPDDDKIILLTGTDYESESEAREILDYIIQYGYDKRNYAFSNNKYWLERINKEGTKIAIAEVDSLQEKGEDTPFDKLVDALHNYAQHENFHVLEHILLRPRIDPQAKTKTVKGMSNAVALIEPAIIDDVQLKFQTPAPPQPFRFIKEEIDEGRGKTSWRLSLVGSRVSEKILQVKDSFTIQDEVKDRMQAIRQAGADKDNYLEKPTRDGQFTFSIVDKDRELATAVKHYKDPKARTEEIERLINFFSFELDLLKQRKEQQEEDGEHIADYADPYSLQLSFFLPLWPSRFREPAFRHLVEKTIYLEMPAHIYANVYWLDYKEMDDFEKAFKSWLETMARNEIPDTTIVNNLVTIINNLRKTK